MQAAPPFTPSIRDSTEPESLHIQQGLYLNIYTHREETRVQYARVMVEGTCVISKSINIRVVCTMHYFCSFFSLGYIYIFVVCLLNYQFRGKDKTETSSLHHFAESPALQKSWRLVMLSFASSLRALLILCFTGACLLGNKSFIANGQKQYYISTLRGFTVQLCPFSNQST